jgi:hypothetical protein
VQAQYYHNNFNINFFFSTYWIRGSIVTVPMCRVCKPKVLRYHNYNNNYNHNAGMPLTKRHKVSFDTVVGLF